jgi:hypothetical protein
MVLDFAGLGKLSQYFHVQNTKDKMILNERMKKRDRN